MSMKRMRQARLPGFMGPYFPDHIDRLNLFLANGCLQSKLLIEEVVRKIKGYKSITNQTTNDGYTWFAAVHFEDGNHEMVLAFPWHQDFSQINRSGADRSAAVYCSELASSHWISSILQTVIVNLPGRITIHSCQEWQQLVLEAIDVRVIPSVVEGEPFGSKEITFCTRDRESQVRGPYMVKVPATAMHFRLELPDESDLSSVSVKIIKAPTLLANNCVYPVQLCNR